MAREFVCVRLVRVTGLDLRLFDFDYDLTWAAFFLSADGTVYGRYGSRDSRDPDARNSLTGLRHALEAALAAHRRARPRGERPAPPQGRPLLAEDYPAARRRPRGECVHCHQVYEFRRAQAKARGLWCRDEVWLYPLPENVGLTLEVDRGDRVRAVAPGSAADRADLRAGDVLRAVNGVPVASLADVQYGLQRAPAAGRVPVTWLRAGRLMAAELEVRPGWRRTNITWRPSLLDLLPSLPLHGTDLTAAERKALGLSAGRLAFRQAAPVHAEARAAGVRAGDVILGLDGAAPEMGMEEFLGHVRRNYLVGDRVTLDVLRGGRRLALPLTLR